VLHRDDAAGGILDDEYPILPINGLKVADVLAQRMAREGYPSVQNYLATLDEGHEDQLQLGSPAETLSTEQ
jgi:hypothetical protein